MKQNNLTGLRTRDFKKLLITPEQDLLGEIIRLNCTVYANSLDVIKVSTHILQSRSNAA